jgi:hypothetical protein
LKDESETWWMECKPGGWTRTAQRFERQSTVQFRPLLICLCADNPLRWVAVPLAATATARTSPTPSPGTTVVSRIPRCVSFPPPPLSTPEFLVRFAYLTLDVNVPPWTNSRSAAISSRTSTSSFRRRHSKQPVSVPTSMSPRRLEKILSTCVFVSTPSTS